MRFGNFGGRVIATLMLAMPTALAQSERPAGPAIGFTAGSKRMFRGCREDDASVT
jgi:hypothetical protein